RVEFPLAPVPFLAVDSVNNRWKTSEDSLFLRLHSILLRDAARRLKRDPIIQIHRLIAAAQRWPSQTAPRQSITERTTFAAARNQSPSMPRFNVCRLKE